MRDVLTNVRQVGINSLRCSRLPEGVTQLRTARGVVHFDGANRLVQVPAGGFIPEFDIGCGMIATRAICRGKRCWQFSDGRGCVWYAPTLAVAAMMARAMDKAFNDGLTSWRRAA